MTFDGTEHHQDNKNKHGGKRTGSGRKGNDIKKVTLGFKIQADIKEKLVLKYGTALSNLLREFAESLLTKE